MDKFSTLRTSVLEQAEIKGKEYYQREKRVLEENFAKELEEQKRRQEEKKVKEINKLQHRHDFVIQQIMNKERQTSLVTKQEILSTLFNEAISVMNSWPKAQELNFFAEVMNKYPQQNLVVKFGAITFDKFDTTDLEKLKATYPQAVFSDATVPFEAGFILSTEKVDYNYLYSMLVNNTREEISSDIASRVFATED